MGERKAFRLDFLCPYQWHRNGGHRNGFSRYCRYKIHQRGLACSYSYSDFCSFFVKINRHYREIAKELAYHGEPLGNPTSQRIIIPVASLTKIVAHTVNYAKTLSPDIFAVHVAIDEDKVEKLKVKWQEYEPDIPLIVLPSPYRAILSPLLEYIEAEEAKIGKDKLITVLIPEFVTKKWWQYFLHNQTGFIVKTALLFKKDIVVASVPIHICH